jgi:hypothetical protein
LQVIRDQAFYENNLVVGAVNCEGIVLKVNLNFEKRLEGFDVGVMSAEELADVAVDSYTFFHQPPTNCRQL